MYSRFGLKEEKDCFTVDCHEIKVFMSRYVKQAAFCSQRGDIDLNLISIEMQMFAFDADLSGNTDKATDYISCIPA